MKIELKLSNETITIITATLQPVYNSKPISRRDKSTLSIALDVVNMLDKKFNHQKLKTDLFNAAKKTKVTFKHHEADMLELLLIQQVKDVQEPYIRHQIQKVINDLNQKLA